MLLIILSTVILMDVIYVNAQTASTTLQPVDVPLDWHNSICLKHKGRYARIASLGVTCCGNQSFFLPQTLVENWESNEQLHRCGGNFHKYNTVDLPAAFWNASLCAFRNASAFPANKVTFENYFKFITDTYTTDVKASIREVTKKCEKDADKEKKNFLKLQKFVECFHKSEFEVCNLPFAPLDKKAVNDIKLDKKYECAEAVGVSGQDRIDYCCKKQSLPYNFLEMYIQIQESDVEQEMQSFDTCSQSFVKRQLDLDPKLKAAIDKFDQADDDETNDDSTSSSTAEEMENPRSLLNHCEYACKMRQKDYTNVKDLKLNFDNTTSFFIRVFGNKIQKDLKKILADRKTTFKFTEADGKTKLTLADLRKNFQKATELEKIKLYCTFVTAVELEVQKSLHEYCFDKEFVDKYLP